MSAIIRLFSPLLAATLLTGPAPAAPPLPSQIANARKVFISNAGGEVNRNLPPMGAGFSGGPDRAYNQFYAAIEASRRFELVSAPGEADLVLEIRFFEPHLWRHNDYMADPQLRLAVRDPKTRTILWALTEHLPMANFQSNRDKDFDQALADMAARFLALRANP